LTINTNIPYPLSPFLNPQTGQPAREWLIWLQNPHVASQTVNAVIINSGTISNVNITNSTMTNSLIDSTIIGSITPASGVFTVVTALNGIAGGVF